MKYLLLTAIILFNANNLICEEKFEPAGTFNLNFHISYLNSSSYYDIDSKEINQIDVPYENEESDDTIYYYTFKYNTYTFGLFGEYFIFDDMSVSAEIPFTYSRLKEEYEYDDNFIKQDRNTYSVTQPDYYCLGLKYRFFTGDVYSYSKLSLFIPPGFHNGIFDDPDYTFLSDGAMVFTPDLHIGYNFEKSWLELQAAYSFRGEELEDMYVIGLEGGLRNIENTALKATLSYHKSANTIDENSHAFNMLETPVHEDYIQLTPSFMIRFDSGLYVAVDYKLKLWAKNSWAGGRTSLYMGYYF